MTRYALLIHPNSVPEVLHRDDWLEADIAEALEVEDSRLEYFPLGRRLWLWQADSLVVGLPVNQAAEQLVGEANYLHIRGPVLVTRDRPGQGLSQRDIASVTAQLVAYRQQGEVSTDN